jgi:hypothetical protein
MDKIIYTLVSKGGGVDGRDFTDKGGKVIAASYERKDLEKNKNLPWCDIVPQVVDIEKATKSALAKLSPVDKLVLEMPTVKRVSK